MNEVLIDETYGRERVQEFIQVAEQERLANRVTPHKHVKQRLSKVRSSMLKLVNAILS